MTLGDAFESIRKNKALAEAFGKDPGGVLNALGVDTKDMNINSYKAGEAPAVTALGVCVSVGCVVCGSVG